VEYITSQNFDRRAFDLLNCITVVPGAVGAWRKDAVILAGLYSSQTLAEDTDLTFKIRRLGYQIVTDNSALAYTEAPDTLRDLAKQRFRWAFGTLQCLWKHRTALFHPRYGTFGTVAMPSLWIYQIGFQAIAPVVDLTIVWSLFYSHFIAPTTDHKELILLLGYWAVFSTVELAGAWLAFRLDCEDKRLLGWLLLQRFVYRQLMYYVIIKSLVMAMRGSLVGWGKLERKGTVQMHTAPEPAPARPPVAH
jgi:peptidoglycan-N-acetylglucosamine deacetylase